MGYASFDQNPTQNGFVWEDPGRKMILRWWTRDARRKTQDARRKTQNAKRKTQNAKRKTQNTNVMFGDGKSLLGSLFSLNKVNFLILSHY